MILSSRSASPARVGARCLEVRFAPDAPVDPVEHQTMQEAWAQPRAAGMAVVPRGVGMGGKAPMSRLVPPLAIMAAWLHAVAPAAAQTQSVVHLEETTASPALGRGLPHVVYTPPGYDPAGPAPASVYLLHGTRSRGVEWITMAKAQATLDRLILGGQLRPVVVVMPDAQNSWYVDSKAVGGPGDYETAIARDLVAQIESKWHTAPTRARRAIAGISMGGFGALRIGFAHPQLYAAAASMSGAFWLRSDQARLPPDVARRIFQGAFGDPIERARFEALGPLGMAAKLNGAAPPSLFLIAGREDHFQTLPESRALAAALAERSIQVEIDDVPGGHEWGTWEISLEPVLMFIERAFRAAGN